MSTGTIELTAACWTSAGAFVPQSADVRSPVSVTDRVIATRRAGFTGFGIGLADLIEARETIGYPALRTILADNGVEVFEIEFLAGWFGTGDLRKRSDEDRRLLLEAAEALGASLIKIGGDFGDLAAVIPHPDVVSREFAELARQAADVGSRVGLEGMPFSNIRGPLEALRIVEEAGSPAGGVFVDNWHVARSGMTFDQLSAIPIESVFGVELSDAMSTVRGSLIDDTFNERRFPGEGQLDVAGFVDTMQRNGYRGRWGVEIISTELRAMPMVEALDKAYTTTMSMFPSAVRH